MRLFWKPWYISLSCGVPALLLIAGQLWLPELLAALGYGPLRGVGLLRFGMICAGAVLAFVAAPLYRSSAWTPQQQTEIDKSREYFAHKRDR